MNKDIKKKNIILSIIVIFMGLAIAGGTFAWLTGTLNVTSGNYTAVSDCFLIDYTDTNQITGTMFPSFNASKGLSGKVTLKVNSSCSVDGIGTIYIHPEQGTSSKFTTTVSAHCENPDTLETWNQYTESSDCTSNNGKWVTNGTPLKYAVFNNSTATGEPIDVGYVNAVGSDVAVYRTFIINKTEKDYYIFLWLDGNLTDNTYTNLPFSGYVKANAVQNNENINIVLPDKYQKVEYIQSNGSQYINTGIIPSNTTGMLLDFGMTSTTGDTIYVGTRGASTDTRFWIAYTSGIYMGFNTNNFGSSISVNTRHKASNNYFNDRKKILDDSVFGTITSTLANQTYPIFIFAFNKNGSPSNNSSYKLYNLKISNNLDIIADYVPCYNRYTNVIGVYDIASGIFLTKSTGNDFGKGSNID